MDSALFYLMAAIVKKKLPNQDTLLKGGFGNLIALPLQKKPREQGCSAFVNGDFEPYPDQWAFLASIRITSRAEIRDERAGGCKVAVKFGMFSASSPTTPAATGASPVISLPPTVKGARSSC